jgi:hypothetical protein
VPHILYYPSPKQFLLRVFFTIIGTITAAIRVLTSR